jgi:hypothetical protein
MPDQVRHDDIEAKGKFSKLSKHLLSRKIVKHPSAPARDI